ncbi:hypothetical protein [Mycoplasma sp. 'Moose RK']|uniref:hypothetical protein n=1 Tax=Mycoplasma sp. 'Moose RK' TaxID=2780095 RepID=UPI001E41AECE|nr:hypothetical protein [Mycoplasma sp. 'Moose RK']
MKQYKFTVEQKIKYTKIAEFQGLKIAILHVYGNNLIRNWQQKFFNNGMKSLISAWVKINFLADQERNTQLTILLKIIVEFIKK